KATEITANATRELVGINRGMLSALQAMQAGIGSAINIITRGGSGDFATSSDNLSAWAVGKGQNILDLDAIAGPIGGVIKVLDGLLGGTLAKITSKLIGASAKIIDGRILIVGDTLGDMLESI